MRPGRPLTRRRYAYNRQPYKSGLFPGKLPPGMRLSLFVLYGRRNVSTRSQYASFVELACHNDGRPSASSVESWPMSRWQFPLFVLVTVVSS
jgi:hypothetical protein